MSSKPEWNDVDALTLAVQTSKTQSEAIRKMGREPQAGTFAHFRDMCHRNGIDYSHLVLNHSKVPLYGIQTQKIESALRECRSIGDAARKIGAPCDARTFSALETFAKDRGLPELPRRSPGVFGDDDLVREVMREAVSAKNALDRMGVAASSKSYALLRQAMDRLNIPPSVFYANKMDGKKRVTTPIRKSTKRPLKNRQWMTVLDGTKIVQMYEEHGSAVTVARELMEELQIVDVSVHTVAHWVRTVLHEHGVILPTGRTDRKPTLSRGTRYRRDRMWKAMCESGKFDMTHCSVCGTPDEWNGVHLTLHIDHIDGDTYNNEPSNLRLLCPNCHSQTDTYCRRKWAKSGNVVP